MAYIAENQDNRQIEFPSRRDYGLPENKFIFCNFNQLHKIDPDIFKAWIRILNRVSNSILWLLRFPALGEDNIRKFAKENGKQIFYIRLIYKSHLLFELKKTIYHRLKRK